MFQEIGDIIRQYRAMLSKSEKRRKATQSAEVLSRLLPTLGPDDTVVDCGANVGAVTGALAGTGAQVIAFEPDPVAFEALSRAHGKTPNVTLHNAAVGIRDGEVELMRDQGFHKNPVGRTTRSTIVPGGRRIAGETIPVKLIDLPAFLRRKIDEVGRIAFLKIDVEGSELDILEVFEEQSLFDHIALTVVETHEKKFAHLRPRFRRLRRRISERYPLSQVNLDWN